MNKTILCLILIALIPLISGTCQEGQVDINTASAEELEKIHQVSDKRAKEIINLRNEKLFESLDDLGRVNGIKLDGFRLKQIKNQSIACVSKPEKPKRGGGSQIASNNTKNNSKTTQTNQTTSQTPNKTQKTETETRNKTEIQKTETIHLNPKNINTTKDTKNKESNEKTEKPAKANIPIYTLIGFCILMAVLFYLRYKKNKYKTEFD